MKLLSIYEAKLTKGHIAYHGAPLSRYNDIITNGLRVGSKGSSSVRDMAGDRFIKGIYVGDLSLAAGYAIGVFADGYFYPGHLYEIDISNTEVMMDTDAFFMTIEKARAGDRRLYHALNSTEYGRRYLNNEIDNIDDTGMPYDHNDMKQFKEALHIMAEIKLGGALSGLIVPVNIGPEAIKAVYLVAPIDEKRTEIAVIKDVVNGRGSLPIGKKINLAQN